MRNALQAILAVPLLLAGCAKKTPTAPAGPDTDAVAKKAKPEWRSLFDGKTLKNWEVVEFGGEGEVKVANGEIIVNEGEELSGIAWKGPDLPRMNYELSLEAKMIDGIDFFCGVGFPVGKEHCSFVVGGWGGGVIGLSSVDGLAANENETASYIEPVKGKWYRILFKVTPEKIDVWLDDKQVVDLETKGRQIDIHPAMDMATPLGLTTYVTRSAFRNIRIRELPKE